MKNEGKDPEGDLEKGGKRADSFRHKADRGKQKEGVGASQYRLQEFPKKTQRILSIRTLTRFKPCGF